MGDYLLNNSPISEQQAVAFHVVSWHYFLSFYFPRLLRIEWRNRNLKILSLHTERPTMIIDCGIFGMLLGPCVGRAFCVWVRSSSLPLSKCLVHIVAITCSKLTSKETYSSPRPLRFQLCVWENICKVLQKEISSCYILVEKSSYMGMRVCVFPACLANWSEEFENRCTELMADVVRLCKCLYLCVFRILAFIAFVFVAKNPP